MSKRIGTSHRPYLPDSVGDRRLRGILLHPRKGKKYVGAKWIFKSDYVGSVHDFVWNSFGDGAPSSSGSDGQSSFSGMNVLSGVTNPRWRDQVRNVVDATTPLSGTLYSFSQDWVSAERTLFAPQGGFAVNRQRVEHFGHVSVPNYGSYTADSSKITQIENRAIRRFLEKLDSTLSSVELGQDLGEYKETIHGITKPVQSLRHHVLSYFDSIKKLKRSYQTGDPGLMKAVSDTYLEWTFGWKPIASDIADTIVGLQNRSRHFAVVPIHASAHDDFSPTEIFGYGNADNYSFMRHRYHDISRSSYKVTYQGVVRTGVVNGTIPVHKVLQLDLPHFIPTVWDLIPYSFVVDYFVNVGDIIRALSACTNRIAWAKKTTRSTYRIDRDFQVESFSSVPTGFQEESCRPAGGRSFLERTDVVRSSISPSLQLLPEVQFTLPTSSKPWENMGFLIANRISKLVPLVKLNGLKG